jgi:DNA-binding NtrC family response regulator
MTTVSREQRSSTPSCGSAHVGRILVVDDEPILRDSLQEFLTNEGFEVHVATTAEEVLQKIRSPEADFDVVLCDVQLPGMDGLELLQILRRESPETFVLMITAYATVQNAVDCFQAGAHDYLMKPIIFEDVLHKLRWLLEYRHLCRENALLRRQIAMGMTEEDQIIGRSPAIRSILEQIRKVGPTPSNVLILGESGTGKELIARAIHRHSQARDKRFLAINCAALPRDLLESQLFGHRRGAFTGATRDQEGLFQSVGDGTIFLDEIGELDVGLQAKLLRAIDQKEVLPVGATEPVPIRCRILAASNRDLAQAVTEGKFREDLYYRLNVVSIYVPPLRERREDIPLLVEHFLAKHCLAMGRKPVTVDNAAMRILMSAPWKGNVRELENAIQRALIMCEEDYIRPEHLPAELVGSRPLPDVGDNLRLALRAYERMHIARVLASSRDKREAARRLGLSVSSLYRRIEELGLEL